MIVILSALALGTVGCLRTQIGSGLYLCIVNGSSNDLMTKQYPEIHNIGKYLNNLIQHNVKAGFLISPTLHEFSRDYYMIGKDPVLPLIEQQGDIVKINSSNLLLVITPKKSSCNIIITNPEVPAFKIEQKIEKELEELIRNMQSAETDPIGLGSTYRAHVKGKALTDKLWLKLLHNAEIKVAVKLKILDDDVELE